jgi:thioredoxin-related protein
MRYLAIPVLLLLTPMASAESPTVDWSDVSETARLRHSPILVIFSADTCGYCEKLKQEVINPLAADPKEERKLLIREFDINAGGKMIDFNGESIRSRQFKQRYGIFATPTLQILDADGHQLSDPLVGYNSANAYRKLLQASLVASFKALE